MSLKKHFVVHHKNNGYAFLDGLLCGLLIAKIGYMAYQDYKETRDWKARWENNDADENVIPMPIQIDLP